MPCLKGRIKSLNLGLSFPLFQFVSFYLSLSTTVMFSNLPQRFTCRFRSDLFLKAKFFSIPCKLIIHVHLARHSILLSATISLSCNCIIPTISNCFRTQTPLCMRITMNIPACVHLLSLPFREG